MNSYKFKYKKFFFYKSIKSIGHKYLPDLNRMDVFHEDGSITSIANWSKYDLHLGTDWVAFTKTQLEKESGHKIDLAVGKS